MKLISFEKSTLLKLGVLSREEGQIYLPDLVEGLRCQLQFVKYPDLTAGTEEKTSLEFFQGKYKDFAIESLGVYGDGIVVKSSTNTAALDELLAFLEQWAGEVFGVKFFPSQPFDTIYESNVIVQAESELFSKLLTKLGRLEKSLKAKVLKDSRLGATFGVSGFTIGAETSPIENFKPVSFRLERKAGTDRKLGYFFSSAPLTTTNHLELLKELEALA
jgi:hypothetical protein